MHCTLPSTVRHNGKVTNVAVQSFDKGPVDDSSVESFKVLDLSADPLSEDATAALLPFGVSVAAVLRLFPRPLGSSSSFFLRSPAMASSNDRLFDC